MTQTIKINKPPVFSDEYLSIKSWLSLLMETYAVHPTKNLAKVITHYLTKLINHDDIELEQNKPYEYASLIRYWKWRANA